MTPKMDYINTLIRSVRVDANLTYKQVEHYTHYARSTVHNWERGQGHPDPDYIARLFSLTADVRLLAYFAPGWAFAPPGHWREVPPIAIRDAVTQALDAMRRLSNWCEFIHRITRDGRIDDRDADTIAQCEQEAQAVREAIATLSQSIAHHRRQDARRTG